MNVCGGVDMTSRSGSGAALIALLAAFALSTGCSSDSKVVVVADAGVDTRSRSETTSGDVHFRPADVRVDPGLEELRPLDFVEDWQPELSGYCDEEPFQFLCPCVDNADCATELCLFHLGEKMCHRPCSEECEMGFHCHQWGTGPDPYFICASMWPSLCLPCEKSADCPSPGDHCVPYEDGAGAFCGGPCQWEGDCPAGFVCEDVVTIEGVAVKQCKTDLCKCTSYATLNALGTTCSKSTEWGECQGWRYCDEDGLTTCDAPLPAQEVCGNDADEDCDGILDDADVCVICSCEGKQCGDDGCGASCGECAVNHVCQLDGTCICVPNCAGKKCGDDGCGTPCGECGVGTKCIAGECQAGCDQGNPCPELMECVEEFCQWNMPDEAILMPPLTAETIPDTATPELVARVKEAGLTQDEGAAAGLVAELGFGPPGFDPTVNPQMWTWMSAVYSADIDGMESYAGTPATATPGIYAYTFRFSLDGAHWVYADSTGLADGFSLGKLGNWVVLAPPAIQSVSPDHGTVLGGTEMTVTGTNFLQGAKLLWDGVETADIMLDGNTITFVAPAHMAALVGLQVQNPSGQTATVEQAFRYLHEFSPNVDGNLDDWDPLLQVGANTLESNWDSEGNHLDILYAAYDDKYLYFGIKGKSEWLNYIVAYVDVDFGASSGVTDMLFLSDNDGDGDLDDTLSSTLNITVPGFGADHGFGTKGMASFQMGNDMAGALYVGWRELGPPYDLAWLQGSVLASSYEQSVEATIPLDTVYPGGLPVGLTQIAIVVKLTDRYGDLGGISNQTLPEYFNAVTLNEVGVVAVFELLL